jgi:putative addiction module killer protein
VLRIERLAAGNFGDWKSVGGGVLELRVQTGPGYRVYACRRGSQVVLLLCGGDKSSQRRDIALARRMVEELEDGS